MLLKLMLLRLFPIWLVPSTASASQSHDDGQDRDEICEQTAGFGIQTHHVLPTLIVLLRQCKLLACLRGYRLKVKA